MSALLELVARCEAATGPDRILDAEIYVGLDPELENHDALAINGAVGSWVPDFTASLDAALTLVPEGWLYNGSSTHSDGHKWGLVDWNSDKVECGHAATPALALCAAALRARAAGESA